MSAMNSANAVSPVTSSSPMAMADKLFIAISSFMIDRFFFRDITVSTVDGRFNAIIIVSKDDSNSEERCSFVQTFKPFK